jgi:hypothetical protein
MNHEAGQWLGKVALNHVWKGHRQVLSSSRAFGQASPSLDSALSHPSDQHCPTLWTGTPHTPEVKMLKWLLMETSPVRVVPRL